MTLVVLLYETQDRDIRDVAAALAGTGIRTIEIPLGGDENEYRIDLTLDGFTLAHRDQVLRDGDLASAALVVYRRYSARNPPPVNVPQLTAAGRLFAEREWAAALHGAIVAAEFAHPGVNWCNRPSLDGILRNKVAMLASARRAGLPVPDLRIGNYTPVPAGDSFVVKAINADEFITDDRKFVTTDFPADLVARFNGQRAPAPTLVQAKVDYRYEVRCYVVGATLLSYRISTPGGYTDSRLVPAEELVVEPVDVDERTSRVLVAWTRERGLSYCAFDLLVDRSDRHLLIDVNPHGTWNWYSVALPDVTRDLTRAFLDLIAGK